MAVIVTDPNLAEEIKAERAASEASRFDEVWEGDYVMPPLANDEHQQVVTRFAGVFQVAIDWPGLGEVRAGVNVSDRVEGWLDNYRIPDLAVFLQGNLAKNCGTHWCGGFDFGIEVVSPDDRSRDKIPFYSLIGVRELLVVDRDPWALELYRSRNGQLELVGRSTVDQPNVLVSEALPLSFCLQADGGRPLIEVTHQDGVQGWLV